LFLDRKKTRICLYLSLVFWQLWPFGCDEYWFLGYFWQVKLKDSLGSKFSPRQVKTINIATDGRI
jgi:hypothetical protein